MVDDNGADDNEAEDNGLNVVAGHARVQFSQASGMQAK